MKLFATDATPGLPRLRTFLTVRTAATGTPA